MSRLCLVVVFNHRFDANLPKLDRLYQGRFGRVHYLMPFYDGARPDVSAVYESSHQFQGYFAQGAPRFLDPLYTHYIFVADDLLLNPVLDESNLLRTLALDNSDGSAGYIKSITALGDTTLQWDHVLTSLEKFRRSGGVQAANELPTLAEARAVFERHGLSHRDIGWANLRGWRGEFVYRNHWRRLVGLVMHKLRRRGERYPLAGGYSDFVVVPASAMVAFTRYCGVLAAMNLFAEVAIPTALALACPRIITEAAAAMKGREIWDGTAVDRLSADHGGSVAALFQAQPEALYFHPIKLSRWD